MLQLPLSGMNTALFPMANVMGVFFGVSQVHQVYKCVRFSPINTYFHFCLTPSLFPCTALHIPSEWQQNGSLFIPFHKSVLQQSTHKRTSPSTSPTYSRDSLPRCANSHDGIVARSHLANSNAARFNNIDHHKKLLQI